MLSLALLAKKLKVYCIPVVVTLLYLGSLLPKADIEMDTSVLFVIPGSTVRGQGSETRKEEPTQCVVMNR